MSDTITMTFMDGHKRQVTREIKQTIDIERFVGVPGFAWLVMAANPHLSAPDIERVIALAGVARCNRSANWIRRRRWLFQPETTAQPGKRHDADGKDTRAFDIMAANPEVSLRSLARLLRDSGINRGLEWVRRHRCDAVKCP